MLRKRDARSSSGTESGSGLWPSEPEALSFPGLCEWLSTDTWDDGSARPLPALILFVDQGRLKVCLSDKAQALVGFLTLETLEGLAESLERHLAADDIDWRPARGAGRRK